MVILTGRNPDRLQHAASELGALATATFDANDSAALEAFFEKLAAPIDHVMGACGGAVDVVWGTDEISVKSSENAVRDERDRSATRW